jgi:hypothetical protein
MTFEEFLGEMSTRRNSVWALHRRGETLDFPPGSVAKAIEKAYDTHDAYLLEALLNLACLHPSSEYTSVACKILEDRNAPWGAEEAALDVLEETMDPVSFDTLVKVCSRPELAFDPTDWRKGLQAITGFYRRNLCDLETVSRALEEISRSGNAIAKMAEKQLSDLRREREAVNLRDG